MHLDMLRLGDDRSLHLDGLGDRGGDFHAYRLDRQVERGLHERASTVGGWVDLASSRQGTTLILSVPLSADAHGYASEFGPDAEDTHPPFEDSADPSVWGGL